MNIPSPGRCIYCPSIEELTKEHIIPEALGGSLVLEGSSCKECAKKTSKFERVVCREMYHPLRLSLGLKGKRPKKQPTHWSGVLIDGDIQQDLQIEIGKLPRIYSVLEMAPPGILSGLPPSDRSPEMTLHLKGNPDDMERFSKEFDLAQIETSSTLFWGPFSRMIAKVCHAYVVSEVGMKGIDFLLPSLIKGESDILSHYVGGISSKEHELPISNDLALGFYEIAGEDYIFGRATFFGNGRFPTYEAIVGKVLDMDLILSKLVRSHS